ncbi:PREDICTED: uncharacterized protein LOC104738074 [Camelina sativa]|uniref:Uncharacterized protein LOC104738074 n=1 Tax=Camelina sativa TaxID=90675 RepID=A0ABM0VIB5_CAMSA|nr:PREDICTED: uncharacterized protein LOC104738074 [Camelina sativa]
MKMKVGFIIVALLMLSVVDISAKEEISPRLSPIEHSSSSPPQQENEMSPISPTMMSNDYDYPPSSQFTESSDLSYTENTRTGGKKVASGGGGNKTGIVLVGAIAAVSMVCFGGGYLFKKRRDNIRRSRYGYVATEFF